MFLKRLTASTITLGLALSISSCSTAEPTPPGLTCSNAKELVVGMTKEDAVAFINRSGFGVRTVREDGVSYAVTHDYREDRMNLFIEQGKVLGLFCG